MNYEYQLIYSLIYSIMSFQTESDYDEKAKEQLFNHLYQKQLKTERPAIHVDELTRLRKVTELKEQAFQIEQRHKLSKDTKQLSEEDQQIMANYESVRKYERVLDQCKVLN
jgi:lysine/ornithine N-monooxygenase